MSLLPFMEPIHVLGGGSIGLFYAASIRSAFPSYPLAVLFKHGRKMQLPFAGGDGDISRTTTTKTRNHDIATVCMRYGTSSGQGKRIARPRMAHVPVQFIDTDNDIYRTKKKTPPIRNILLSTKAFQAVDAIEGIVQRLDQNNTIRIIVLCNGALDVREKLIETLQTKHNIHNFDLIMCTTTQGVYQELPDEDMFHLIHIGSGRTIVGNSSSSSGSSSSSHNSMSPLAQLLDQSGLNAHSVSSDEMEIILWKKLAANCICNPLTALWQVTNGQLVNQPEFSTIRNQIVSEVSLVGQATVKDDETSSTNLQEFKKSQLSEHVLDEFVEQVIQDNLDNKSSMYHDIKYGRRTEIDNLNGYIVKKGRVLGIDTPQNAELLSLIKKKDVA